MSQVGAADSKMTLDVYAQREQRVQRNHGAGSDRLVRQARAQLGDGADDPLTAAAAWRVARRDGCTTVYDALVGAVRTRVGK
jgi:hypothetical protein